MLLHEDFLPRQMHFCKQTWATDPKAEFATTATRIIIDPWRARVLRKFKSDRARQR